MSSLIVKYSSLLFAHLYNTLRPLEAMVLHWFMGKWKPELAIPIAHSESNNCSTWSSWNSPLSISSQHIFRPVRSSISILKPQILKKKKNTLNLTHHVSPRLFDCRLRSDLHHAGGSNAALLFLNNLCGPGIGPRARDGHPGTNGRWQRLFWLKESG